MREDGGRPRPERQLAERLTKAARAAQELCDTLWETLHEELRDPRPERVAELSDRLAEVSSTVAMLAAVAHPDGPVERRRPPASLAPSGAPPQAPAEPRGGPDLRLAPQPAPVADHAPAPSEPEPDPPVAFERYRSTQPEPAAPAFAEPVRPQLVDEHETAAADETPVAVVEPITPMIEVRDARREEGPNAWVSSVGRLLARHAEDGLPFAVLLIEVVDVARLERAEPHELTRLLAQVESALGSGLRATDELTRESFGRYWLIAAETNGTGARMLAERLARVVRASATHRGAPLAVAVGIAICPDDGTEVPALTARADLGVYSARATGRSVAHADPPV